MENKSEDTGIPTVARELIGTWAGRRLARPPLSDPPLLDAVFRDILWTARQYIPCESGSICLAGLSEPAGELVYVAAFGEGSDKIVGARLPVGSGLTGRAFREGRPVLQNDVRQDADFFPGFDEATHYTTRSLLAVPVDLAGETAGVIGLFNRREREGFRPEDLKLLEILGGYASNSLLNLTDALQQREIARRDDLTGLYNDRFFHQQLRHELERLEGEGGDLSLLFIDLDRFKAVVDTHGHLVGSEVIGETGRLIARTVREARATLARYGGDEFVVILPGCGAESAVAVAESIRSAVAGHVFLAEAGADGRPALSLRGAFSASIGVASYRDCPFAGKGPGDWKVRQRDFIQVADEAMYRAKRLGRDRVELG